MKRSERTIYEVEYCGECDEPLDDCMCEFEDDQPPQCFPHYWLPSAFDPRFVVCGKCGEPGKAGTEKAA